MDLKTRLLYQVILAMFLYFTHCHFAASDPVKRNMLEAIAACDSVKFLRNSSYVNKCSALSYPVGFTTCDTDKDEDLNLMCITLNHITNKICEYHISAEKSQIKVPETAEKFDEEVKKLEPKSEDRIKFAAGWCQNTTLFSNVSIENDTDVLYKECAKKKLLNKTECTETCQIRYGVSRFCMVFLWFERLYNTLQPSKHIDTSIPALVPRKEPPQKSVEIIEDNNNEPTSIANQKSSKEHAKSSKILETGIEIPNNANAESMEAGKEQEVKKNIQQSQSYEGDQTKPDLKLPPSTGDKLNIVDNKIDNSKTENQEVIDDFMDEERRKPIEDGTDGENDHEIMETNKKNSFSDSGDQHSLPESSVIKEEDESHFFMYFSIVSFACVMLYIGYHNKQKVLAIVLEGRQSRRGRSNRRRPNTANYRKLDSNLEEAVTSQCNSNVTHVIY